MNNELAKIQAAVKAPKGQFNSFGKYKYRSCEDIVEAVKPVINAMGFSLILSDEVVFIGNRFYIKATATITNNELTFSAEAYAREEETKKGMDGAQITGAASSYARKYALNGLFAIDDTLDADSTNNHSQEVTSYNHKKIEKQGRPLISNSQFKALMERVRGGDIEAYGKAMDAFSFDASQQSILDTEYKKQQGVIA